MRSSKLLLSALLVSALSCLACSTEAPDLDEGSDPEIADLIAAGATAFTGTIPANGWRTHALDVPSTSEISVVLDWSRSAVDLNVFLYDPAGKLVVFANGAADKPEDVYVTGAAKGAWSIGIKNKHTSRSTSYTLAATVTTIAPPPPPPPPVVTYPGRPASGHLFWGSSIGGNGDAVTRHETPSGSPLALHRTFYQWSQRTTSMVNMARSDLAAARLPWVSTKTPSWAEMAAGTHDAAIDEMLRALDALGGPVWLTIHHEPEGGGGVNAPDDPAGPAGHVAMNRRVRARMTVLGTKHIALAPILMSWTWTTQSGRDVESWFAPGIYDFMGVDHYNDNLNSLDDATWRTIRLWAAAHDVELAVGEWGMRGTDAAAGARVRAWYDAAIASETDGLGARVVGLSAFDSNLNSPSGGWELMGAQLTTFWELLGDARTESVTGL